MQDCHHNADDKAETHLIFYFPHGLRYSKEDVMRYGVIPNTCRWCAEGADDDTF